MQEAFLYTFGPGIEFEDADATLLLARSAAVSLHGDAELRLNARQVADPDRKTLLLETGTQAGRDLNRLFVGFLERQFGAETFQVERVSQVKAANVLQLEVVGGRDG